MPSPLPGLGVLVIACHDHDLENLARMNRHLPDGTRLHAADTKRTLRLRDGTWTADLYPPPAPAPHSHLHTQGDEVAGTPCTDLDCPMRWCSCGPGERCFDCATDEELAAAVPPWPSMGGQEQPR